jgi:hypothetical protein
MGRLYWLYGLRLKLVLRDGGYEIEGGCGEGIEGGDGSEEQLEELKLRCQRLYLDL